MLDRRAYGGTHRSLLRPRGILDVRPRPEIAPKLIELIASSRALFGLWLAWNVARESGLHALGGSADCLEIAEGWGVGQAMVSQAIRGGRG